MAAQPTLAIIKPDAVASGKAGRILAHLAAGGLRHPGRPAGAPDPGRGRGLLRGAPGPAVLRRAGGLHDQRALPADGAGAGRRRRHAPDGHRRHRPAEAAAGTIRKLYAESKGRNAIHASDSDENAAREIGFFFTEGELAGLWG